MPIGGINLADGSTDMPPIVIADRALAGASLGLVRAL
jgi:hypothetical protein